MKPSLNIVRTLLLASAVVLICGSAALACPSCKAALGEADQAGLVSGFFWSILFMMSMPFAILGTFGVCAYRAVNKARAEQAAKAAAEETVAAQTADERESELVEV